MNTILIKARNNNLNISLLLLENSPDDLEFIIFVLKSKKYEILEMKKNINPDYLVADLIFLGFENYKKNMPLLRNIKQIMEVKYKRFLVSIEKNENHTLKLNLIHQLQSYLNIWKLKDQLEIMKEQLQIIKKELNSLKTT